MLFVLACLNGLPGNGCCCSMSFPERSLLNTKPNENNKRRELVSIVDIELDLHTSIHTSVRGSEKICYIPLLALFHSCRAATTTTPFKLYLFGSSLLLPSCLSLLFFKCVYCHRGSSVVVTVILHCVISWFFLFMYGLCQCLIDCHCLVSKNWEQTIQWPNQRNTIVQSSFCRVVFWRKIEKIQVYIF